MVNQTERMIKRRGIYNLALGGIALTSLIGAFETGIRAATGQNIGILMPALSTILPTTFAIHGYQFGDPLIKGDILSDNFEIVKDRPIRGCLKYLARGLVIQAIPFSAGYLTGYLTR